MAATSATENRDWCSGKARSADFDFDFNFNFHFHF